MRSSGPPDVAAAAAAARSPHRTVDVARVRALDRPTRVAIASHAEARTLADVVRALVQEVADGDATRAEIEVTIARGTDAGETGADVVARDDGRGRSREELRALRDCLGDEHESTFVSETETTPPPTTRRAWRAIFGVCRGVEIVSRTRGSAETTCLTSKDGEATLGTCVEAWNERWTTTTTCRSALFRNRVARVDMVERYAMTRAELRSIVFHACVLRPWLKIRLVMDGAVVERVEEERRSVLDGLRTAFGEEADRLLALDHESADGEWRIRGYVNPPDRRFGSSEMQFVYVNGRHVRGKSNGLYHAVMRQEERAFLGEGARNLGKGFPAFLISIECREDAFEIVHDPSKTLIEFQDWSLLVRHLEEAIVRAWPVREDPTTEGSDRNVLKRAHGDACACCPPKGPFRQSALLKPLPAADAAPVSAETSPNPVFDAEVPIMEASRRAYLRPPAHLERHVLFSVSVLGQVGLKFIVCVIHVGEEGAIVAAIDQHAADERISLEELWATVLSPNTHVPTEETQSALWATPLSVHEFEVLETNAQLVRRWGWDWRTSANDSAEAETVVYLTRVPTIRGTSLGGDALRQFLFQLQSTTASTSQAPRCLYRLLASKACRGAIMFGDYLSTKECETIINALRLTQLPFSCAHGRPTCAPLVRVPPKQHRHRADIPNIRAWIRAKRAKTQ